MRSLYILVASAMLLAVLGCSGSGQGSGESGQEVAPAKTGDIAAADAKEAVDNLLESGGPAPVCTLDGKCTIPADTKNEAERKDIQKEVEKKSIDAAQEKLGE